MAITIIMGHGWYGGWESFAPGLVWLHLVFDSPLLARKPITGSIVSMTRYTAWQCCRRLEHMQVTTARRIVDSGEGPVCMKLKQEYEVILKVLSRSKE